MKESAGVKDQSKDVYIAQGIEWLLKAGAIENPDVQDALFLNVLIIDDKINDVAFVCDSENLRMLVYIELYREKNFFKRLYRKIRILLKKEIDLPQEEIGQISLNKLHQVLPNFDIRVTFNRSIYEKSLEVSDKLKGSREELYKQVRD